MQQPWQWHQQQLPQSHHLWVRPEDLPCSISAVNQQLLLMSYAGCPYYENYGYSQWTGQILNNGTADSQPDMGSCRTFCKNNYAEARYFTWRSNKLACRCRRELMLDKMIEKQDFYVGVITCKGKYECVTPTMSLCYVPPLQRLLS